MSFSILHSQFSIKRSWAPHLFLSLIALILIALWLPNAHYLITQDPVGYALLSKSLWETGTYQILGKPDDVFVPMLPIVSYPFIWIFGLNFGMKLVSLVAGILFAVSIFTFFWTYFDPSRTWNRHPERVEGCTQDWLPYVTVALLTIIPYITWLLSVGNADLLYGALFFLVLTLYLHAEKKLWLYPVIGILIGITMLTRYMGAALLAIIVVDVFISRRKHLWNPYFLSLFPLALGIFSLWFIRHKMTFDTWFSTFHISYTVNDQSPILPRLIRNTLYYINPIHSVLALTPFTIIGLWFFARKYIFLTLCIPLSILLCYVYPSLTTRFLIATIPFLLTFTALGIKHSLKLFSVTLITSYLIIAGFFHAGLTCFYTLPACNAAIDQWEFSFIPANAKLAHERAESTAQAIDWINEHAMEGATVISATMQKEDLPVWESSGRFRLDMKLSLYPSCDGPTYEINGRENVPMNIPVLFGSSSRPVEVVRLIPPEDCRNPLGRDPEWSYWHTVPSHKHSSENAHLMSLSGSM